MSTLLASFALATLCSCTAHRSAGSMAVTKDNPVLLRVRSADPAELNIEIWNRGPGDVRFEQVQPGTNEFAKGVLKPNANEFRWIATTRHLELSLTTDSDATIAYTLESDRGVEMFMGTR